MIMPNFLRTGKRLAIFGALASVAMGQSGNAALAPQGTEYRIGGARPGDQVLPQLSLSSLGGFVVWQDNFTDGDGLGISAVRITGDGLPSPSAFRINENSAGDQENVQIAMLNDGGAAVAWQGGALGFQDIYIRFIKSDGTFATGDIRVNSYVDQSQQQPSIAVLPNGNVVVVWGSQGQDGHLQGVFGQILDSAGNKVGEEFQVNESTQYNQRTPAVAALSNGRFVVTWVSEKSRGITTDAIAPSGVPQERNAGRTIFGVDVYARIFQANAEAVGTELLVNTGLNICANPAISAQSKGGFAVAWGEDNAGSTDSWDVVARSFDSAGIPAGTATRLNARIYGDQFSPKIAGTSSGYIATWTSLAQDGSMDGIFGRNLTVEGAPDGDEFQVNTTTVSKQIQAVPASDGERNLIVVWSGFTIGSGFDLYAQRYTAGSALPEPQAPVAHGISGSKILVTWPELTGFPGASYVLHVDGREMSGSLLANYHVVTGLAPGSSHQFRLGYRLPNGLSSGLSVAATASTWGEDENGDGLPDDWQALHWPNSNETGITGADDYDADGASNFKEFLAGTNPRDAKSALKLQLRQTGQGLQVEWNTQPGFIYQLQTSSDSQTWTDVGGSRFAAGAVDSVLVNNSNNLSMFRVVRIR